MNMFGMGWQEFIVIVIIALLFFGAQNIPDVVKSLGQAIVNFKENINKPQKDITDEVEKTNDNNDEK
jgi:sec-independent protein translocase protein TatA